MPAKETPFSVKKDVESGDALEIVPFSVSCLLDETKGTSPVSTRYTTHPNDHMSTALVYPVASKSRNSGAW